MKIIKEYLLFIVYGALVFIGFILWSVDYTQISAGITVIVVILGTGCIAIGIYSISKMYDRQEQDTEEYINTLLKAENIILGLEYKDLVAYVAIANKTIELYNDEEKDIYDIEEETIELLEDLKQIKK